MMNTIESQFKTKELIEFENYTFGEYTTLSDDTIFLQLKAILPVNIEKQFLPRYLFNIVLNESGIVVGWLVLRGGLTDVSLQYGGHIGFAIEDKFQGNSYASRALALIRKFTNTIGLPQILLTCDDDNIASRKTIENAGGKLHKIVTEIQIPNQDKKINCCYYTIESL